MVFLFIPVHFLQYRLKDIRSFDLSLQFICSYLMSSESLALDLVSKCDRLLILLSCIDSFVSECKNWKGFSCRTDQCQLIVFFLLAPAQLVGPFFFCELLIVYFNFTDICLGLRPLLCFGPQA